MLQFQWSKEYSFKMLNAYSQASIIEFISMYVLYKKLKWIVSMEYVRLVYNKIWLDRYLFVE